MDASKIKYLKETKVYSCSFELELFELKIFLKFPCKFFVEWKTNGGNKHTKTEGYVSNVESKVIFNQKLRL